MENEKLDQVNVKSKQKSVLHEVTPLSKYLAMVLFIIMPFLGGWIGYTFAPKKIVEVEKEVIREVEVEKVAQLDKKSGVIKDKSNMQEGIVAVQDDEIKSSTTEFVNFTKVSVDVDQQIRSVQFDFIPQAALSITYPSGWVVDDFRNQVIKGNGYEILVRINNPSTPGVPDTDLPREYIMASILNRSCEGTHASNFGEFAIYDTGWVENGFIEEVFTRHICVPGENGYFHLDFNPLLNTTRDQIDSYINEMFNRLSI